MKTLSTVFITTIVGAALRGRPLGSLIYDGLQSTKLDHKSRDEMGWLFQVCSGEFVDKVMLSKESTKPHQTARILNLDFAGAS